MVEEIVVVLKNALVTTTFLAVVAVLFREALLKAFNRSVEYRFAKKIEETKAELNAQEKQLDFIRGYLRDQKMGRNTALFEKRFAAAEEVIKASKALAQFTMTVEFLKIVDVEKLRADSRSSELAASIQKASGTDGSLEKFSSLDLTKPKLYLDSRSLAMFEAYQSILLHAALTMKMLSLPIDSTNLVKDDALRKTVVDLVPNAAKGFDDYGHRWAYYWLSYFHDEMHKSLRAFVNFEEEERKDVDAVVSMNDLSLAAQTDVRQLALKAGLPEAMLVDPEQKKN